VRVNTDPLRIMTVCTGNICRSPIAEVVLRDRFAAAGLAERVVVDSSGISDEEDGNPIDRRAAAVLREHGYEVPTHRAHQVTVDEIAHRDLLLAMTARHAQWLRSLDPDAEVRLYRSFEPGAEGSGPDMADPWYGGREDFERTLEEVEAAADAIVEHVARML
jgi:protein-tyrosine phosphatase